MSQKVPVSGVVEAVNDRGFKINGKWFNKANKFSGAEPEPGTQVAFDAYGPREDIVYRFAMEGNGNGSGPVQQPSVAANHSAVVRTPAAGGNHRATALMAAATLLQGSEGKVQEIAANTVAVARAFEVYLGSSVTGSTVQPEADDSLYWVAPVVFDLGMEELA